MDQNPWTNHTPTENPNPNPISNTNQPDLPLPPNPSHPAWKNRCYMCLDIGHDQNDCLSEDRVCARCWKKGHLARDCGHSMVAKRQRFDPLEPRSNMGESGLPPNRPQSTVVFIPSTPHIHRTNTELSKAIIIDARLRPSHCHNTIQSLLMTASHSQMPFPLTHLADTRYVLLLPAEMDRDTFLNTYGKRIKELGLVAYPWSAGIDTAKQYLKYKVWIELRRMTPQQWNLDHLIPAISTFGVVLEHSPMQGVRSFEKIMAVIALPDLSNIPRQILMWERCCLRDIEVIVHNWIEEPIQQTVEEDTTPPPTVFEEVRKSNLLALSGLAIDKEGKEVITIEYDTLLAIWGSMPEGSEKDKIEESLKNSPHYINREYERCNRVLALEKGKGLLTEVGEGSAQVLLSSQIPVLSPVYSPVQPSIRLDSLTDPTNGEDASRVILQSINCISERGEHKTGKDLLSQIQNISNQNVGSAGQGLSAHSGNNQETTHNQFSESSVVGLTKTQRELWADMEDAFDLGLESPLKMGLLTPAADLLSNQINMNLDEDMQLAQEKDNGADLQPNTGAGLMGENELEAFVQPIPQLEEVTDEPEEVVDEPEEVAHEANPVALAADNMAEAQPNLQDLAAQVNLFPQPQQGALNQEQLQNLELAQPNLNTQPELRRSVRILEKGTSVKVYKTRRATRNANKNDKVGEEEAKNARIAIVAALQDEVLASNPLTEE